MVRVRLGYLPLVIRIYNGPLWVFCKIKNCTHLKGSLKSPAIDKYNVTLSLVYDVAQCGNDGATKCEDNNCKVLLETNLR